MAEQLANAAQSTLAAAINAEVTELTLAEGTAFGSDYGEFPTDGTFSIIVGDELMRATGVNTETRVLTVERGAEGSTAAEHAEGAQVTVIMTSAAMQGFAVPKSLVDAKGDLLVSTAADTVARKAVGTTGHGLVANSAKSDGLEWKTMQHGNFGLPTFEGGVMGFGTAAYQVAYMAGVEGDVKGSTGGFSATLMMLWATANTTIKHEDSEVAEDERFRLLAGKDLEMVDGDIIGGVILRSLFEIGWVQLF
jgi:hypothetical protein